MSRSQLDLLLYMARVVGSHHNQHNDPIRLKIEDLTDIVIEEQILTETVEAGNNVKNFVNNLNAGKV